MCQVRVAISVGSIAVNVCLVRHLDSQLVYRSLFGIPNCFASIVYPICVNGVRILARILSVFLVGLKCALSRNVFGDLVNLDASSARLCISILGYMLDSLQYIACMVNASGFIPLCASVFVSWAQYFVWSRSFRLIAVFVIVLMVAWSVIDCNPSPHCFVFVKMYAWLVDFG